ncbi:MAG TPA: hypothetical protein VGI39_20895 [Polyangiaceae bacterium]|jgi:hypothetical protein
MAKLNGHADRGSALTAAAGALEVELRRYEELAAAAIRMPLTSEKTIERAARAIGEAAEAEKRVLGQVKALVEAVGAAREAQETSTGALNAQVARVSERRAELEPLLARFAQLGDAARTLNEALLKVAAYKPNPYAEGDGDGEKEAREALAAVEAGMVACAGHAGQLSTDALAREFEELGRQAEGLRQQILAAKNRLGLLQKAAARES